MRKQLDSGYLALSKLKIRRQVIFYHFGPSTADSMDLVNFVQLIAGVPYFISMGTIVS